MGQANTFTIKTTGFPAPTIGTVSSLPPGLTFTNNGNGTATISGTPLPTGNRYAINLTANNSVGAIATQVLTLNVNEAPAITSGASKPFTTGAFGSFSITTVRGFPTSLATSLSESGVLPKGVTFKNLGGGNAQLSGTPAAGSGGTYVVAITATNFTVASVQFFTITVNQAPAFTSANTVVFSTARVNQFTVSATGFPAPTFSVQGGPGSLPTGVVLTSAGILRGTPTSTGPPHS